MKTRYFNAREDAIETREIVSREFPDARIVDFTKGYAVQYFKSGPYFPDAQSARDSRFNPANA